MCAHARRQFPRDERLADEIIAAGIQRIHHGMRRIIARQEDDRCVGGARHRPESAAQGQTIHVRHHRIDHKQIGRFVFNGFQCGLCRKCPENVITFALQYKFYHIQNLGVVVYYHDFVHRFTSRLFIAKLYIKV
ncbi:MAG: hypothetical protein IPK17_04840 [Chloroflexi bacterium]|nr:hypothetical protein [Chloroflexota bacterium]